MQEILIALIVSAAYPLGAVLYYFTRDELVFRKIGKALRKTSYICPAVSGIITFALAYYEWLGWAAALFIILLIKSAFASIGLKKKSAIRTAAIQEFIFLMFFFALYLLI